MIMDISERKRSEDGLMESQERLDLALQGADLGLWDLDLTTGLGIVNERMLEIIEYSPGEIEISLDSWQALIHPDDLSGVRDHLKQHFDGLVDFVNHEYRIRTKSGRYFWVLARGRVVKRGSDGRPLRMAGLMDITLRKRAEEELHSTVSRFHAILSSLYGGVLLVTNDGDVEFANEAFCNLFGLDDAPINLRGLKAPEIIDKIKKVYADPDNALFRIREIISKNRPVKFEEIGIVGGRTYARDFIPIMLDGGLYGRFWHHIDITDRKQTEDALAESELKYRLLFDEAPVGMMSVSKEGEILEINRSQIELLGSPGAEATKQINMFAFPPLVAAGISEKYKACILEGQKIIFEAPYTTRWGKRTCLRSMLTPRYNKQGKVEGCLAVIEDVIKRKQAEHEKEALQTKLLQAQKMEAVGTLAGGIAHDFNNLLQAVLGYSELMLRRKNEGEKDHADLQKIYEAGQRGADLVKGLLTFSRKVETKSVSVNLNQEITHIQTLLSRTIPKTIKFDLHLSGDLESIEADPSQIGQVLMNLGVNARDAMPDGGILTIETANVELDDEYCRAHLTVNPGRYALLTVSDTGQGMDRETMTHIFEPFFSTKQVGKGTGLGLATVYGIVKQHGGHIVCYSDPGRGTTFRIYFPVIQTEETSEIRESERPICEGPETILLVDDEETVREFGAAILSEFGYKVITAHNGREALEVYRGNVDRIGLVLLDLIMPEMDGNRCLKEILRINPEAKVIIASGYTLDGRSGGMLGIGAKGIVAKPYSMRQLLNRVRTVLDKD